jgi:release factor glutamine methyltransferase
LGDLFAPIEGQTFDLIVSNPPYIATDEIQDLSKEVREYEPHMALDGGADGLDFVRRIYQHAKKFLTPYGACIVEIGEDQGAAAKKIAEDAGFTTKIRKDYEVRDRVVVAKQGTAPVIAAPEPTPTPEPAATPEPSTSNE